MISLFQTPALVGAAILLSLVLGLTLTRQRPVPGIPILHPSRRGLARLLPAKVAFVTRGGELLAQGSEEYPNRCFQVSAACGYKVIVPNKFADELKNNPNLSLIEGLTRDLFAHYAGFEGMRSFTTGTILLDTIKSKLNPRLDLVTQDLVEETADALEFVFEDIRSLSQSQIRYIKQDMLEVVARLSTRVLLGKSLARDPDWLQIAKQYAVDVNMAGMILHLFPAALQPLAHWTLPVCWRLRKHVRIARRLMRREVENAQVRKSECNDMKKQRTTASSSLDWMAQLAGDRPFDYVGGQLGISVAAIHTTSEMSTKAILALCSHPEIVPHLREEARNHLDTHGWTKKAISSMELLDSFLKEIHRLNRGLIASMDRLATRSVALSDGTVIPAGARIVVREVFGSMPDSSEPDPDWAVFDAWRYMPARAQQRADANKSRFTSTSSDNMGFGHGRHACPGRFFAALEVKVVLCAILMGYDVSHTAGNETLGNIEFEYHVHTNPGVRVAISKRQI